MVEENFSIIIPVFNTQNAIGKCLKRILEEKSKNDEIIVVDNNSTDKSTEIIKQFPVKYLLCTKKGASAARNYGVKYAKYNNILFLDSDVLIQKDSINKIRKLICREDVSAVNGIYSKKAGYNGILSKFQNLYSYNNYIFMRGKKKRFLYNSFWTAFCAIKKKVFNDVNGFDETLLGLEDIDLGIRLGKKGYKIMLDKTIQNIHYHKYNFKNLFTNYYGKTKAWVKISLNKGILKYEGHDDIRSKVLLVLADIFILLLLSCYFYLKFISVFLVFLPISAILLYIIINHRFFRLTKKTYGYLFLLISIPLCILAQLFISIGILGGVYENIFNKKKIEKERKCNELKISEFFRYGKKILFKKNVMPEALIFFITSKCNAKCKHCFFWKDINQEKNELTLNEIKLISKKMSNFSHLFISGGEPFLREDLPEIVETFYRNNNLKSISIPTNGLLTDKIINDLNIICKRNPELKLIIDISIDNINKKHDEIRGVKGLFKNVLKTLKKIKEIKKIYPNLNLGVICVYNSKNQKDIYKIYKFIKDKIQPDSISFPLIRGNPKDKSYKKVNLKEYKGFITFLEKEFKQGYFPGYNNFLLNNFSNIINIEIRNKVYKIAKYNKYLFPCYACQLIGTIYSNGDVHCCEMLPNKIGNLRDADYDLKKIWFSKRAKRARLFIKNNKCFCTHECFIYPSLLFNSKNLINLLIKYVKFKIFFKKDIK